MDSLKAWTFGLAAVVIVGAVAAVWAFLFAVRRQTRAQYRVVIVLLFFALSCVTSILFATSSQAELRGGLEGFSFTVIGPAALWLIGLFAFFRFVPEDSLFRNPGEDPDSLKAITTCIAEIEGNQGWSTYSDWKDKLRGFQYLFDIAETATLKNLLHATYFTHEAEKLNEPRISTLWLYFPKSILKIQRIRGRKEGARASIRFSSNPTAVSANATSVFLVGDKVGGGSLSAVLGFTENDVIQYRGLQEVAFEPVDCLILTLYDDPEMEDYLLVDMKRFSLQNQGSAEIAVACFEKKILASSLWTIKQPVFAGEGRIPLAIRKSPGTTPSGPSADFGDWLATVDRAVAGPQRSLKPAVIEVLKRAQSAMTEGSPRLSKFKDLEQISEVATGYLSYSIPEARDVTMLLVRFVES